MVIPQPLPDAEPEPDIRSYNHGTDSNTPHDAPAEHQNAVPDASKAEPTQLPQLPPALITTSSSTSSDDDDADAWEEPTYWQGFKNMIRAVPVLVTIPILCPIAWALHFSHQSAVATFVVSLLAIVPLAGGLGFATEELAARIGDAWGGLLNASFGNAVELLISILALVKGDLDIVQASMAGSILSNILLVLGMSYFAGGLRFHEQLYTVVGAQTHIALLGITIAAILLPEAYHLSFPATKEAITSSTVRGSAGAIEGKELQTILAMSRGLSFILLLVYGMYLTFQLWTHAYLFKMHDDEDEAHDALPEPTHTRVFPKPHWVPSLHTVMSRDTWHADGRTSRSSTPATPTALGRVPTSEDPARRRLSNIDLGAAALHQQQQQLSPALDADMRWREKRPAEEDICDMTVATPISTPPHLTYAQAGDMERGNVHFPPLRSKRKVVAHLKPRVPMYFALAGMVVCTGLAGITAEALVSSIDGLTESTSVSREFIGLIVLPVVGNAVEHITAVTVSLKDRLNLSLSIAVGSSVQVSLCILPLLVLLGWAVGQPMTLLFDTFETICLVIAVVLVNFAISDGRSNYLEGFILMMAFVCIATVCWFYDPAH